MPAAFLEETSRGDETKWPLFSGYADPEPVEKRQSGDVFLVSFMAPTFRALCRRPEERPNTFARVGVARNAASQVQTAHKA